MALLRYDDAQYCLMSPPKSRKREEQEMQIKPAHIHSDFTPAAMQQALAEKTRAQRFQH